ncbi:MAG: peptidylprolyl isomerase [Clostridiales Family XIII bacterium]|nr:peptidylprolyl isomerase [Clostridiales Family XIII bacterium]
MIEITMESGGVITLELDPEAAPITVENFLKLVNEGFYDGLTFHRIIPGFMIQGGDPIGNGTGGSEEYIKGEFSGNGVDNPISHTRGVISMARQQDPDSARSQFFITNADRPDLDGGYAAFGTVIAGMDVIDEISAVPTDSKDRPLEPVVIGTIKEIKS